MTLSPAHLHALSIGLDRLGDGDVLDAAVRGTVIRQMVVDHGLVFERGGFVPVAEATQGYALIDGEFVFVAQQGNGSWSSPLAKGRTIYLDEGGTIPLRVLLPA